MALLRAAKKDEVPAGTIREFQLDGDDRCDRECGREPSTSLTTYVCTVAARWARANFTANASPARGMAGSTMSPLASWPPIPPSAWIATQSKCMGTTFLSGLIDRSSTFHKIIGGNFPGLEPSHV